MMIDPRLIQQIMQAQMAGGAGMAQPQPQLAQPQPQQPQPANPYANLTPETMQAMGPAGAAPNPYEKLTPEAMKAMGPSAGTMLQARLGGMGGGLDMKGPLADFAVQMMLKRMNPQIAPPMQAPAHRMWG